MQGAIIIHETEFKNTPLYFYEINNCGKNSIGKMFKDIKQIIGYCYDNRNMLLNIISGGHMFSFSVYKIPNKPNNYELTFWDYRGSVALLSKTITVEDWETSPIPNKDFLEIREVLEAYSNGYINCSGCSQQIKINNVAGQYFAERYCVACWENKYKAIEARENYE